MQWAERKRQVAASKGEKCESPSGKPLFLFFAGVRLRDYDLLLSKDSKRINKGVIIKEKASTTCTWHILSHHAGMMECNLPCAGEPQARADTNLSDYSNQVRRAALASNNNVPYRLFPGP